MEKVVLELKELNKKYQKLLGVSFPIWKFIGEMYSYKIMMADLEEETATLIRLYYKEKDEILEKYGLNTEDYLKIREQLELEESWDEEEVEEYFEDILEEYNDLEDDVTYTEVLDAIEFRIKLIDEMYQKKLKLETSVWEYTDGCSVEFMHSNDFEQNMRQWLYRYIQDVTLVLDLYGWDFGTLMDNIEYTNSLDIWN